MKTRLTHIRKWLAVCVSVAGIFMLDSHFGTVLYSIRIVNNTDISTTFTFDCESWEQAYAREQQLSMDDEKMFVERKPMFIFHKWISCQTL